jgi:hypothetical protein
MPVRYGVAQHMLRKWTQLLTACHHVTGCLKQTNVDKLYTLSGINPPQERGMQHAEQERAKQSTDP